MSDPIHYGLVLLACGSRNAGLMVVIDALNEIIDETDECIELIVGDCPTGADRYIREWGEDSPGVDMLTPFIANWNDGRKAGPLRNRAMLDHLGQQAARGMRTLVLAFWDGRTSGCGTFDVIREANRRGHEIRIFTVKL